jgi:isocitrate lyase
MANYNRAEEIAYIKTDWAENPRWKDVTRNYSAEDVVRLRGSMKIENTLATQGAEKLWDLVNGGAKKGYVNALGTLTGGQAIQQAAGISDLSVNLGCCG